MAKNYPECGYLGSDAAELMAFSASLRLVREMDQLGHTEACARLMVLDNRVCSCKARKAGTR